MTFQVKVQEVNIETVQKGKNRYQVASVNYVYNGQARTQKIFSFSNPQVFTVIQKITPGDMVSVTTAKNDAGYNEWAKVEPVVEGDALPVQAAKAGGNKVIGSNYETADERAKRQLMIVRQSSISNAIARAAQHPDPNSVDVLSLAQMYVDFVYGNKEDAFADLKDDLPS